MDAGAGVICNPCVAVAKPPIYPVEVIEVACRALEAIASLAAAQVDLGKEAVSAFDTACQAAARIVADGLASHEKAIKGES